VAHLADVAAAESARAVFAIVDEAVVDLAPVRAVFEALERAGSPVTVRPKAPGEPTIELVEAVAGELGDANADLVVGVGGGSVLDTAKAARLVAGQRTPYRRFLAREATVEPPGVPLALVPTTAGTGSEVSGGAVIADEVAHVKRGIASPLLRAQHALVDPALTYGLPPEPTAQTGVDALAQAIAAVVVEARTPVGTAVALEAVRLAAGALPHAVRDGSDTAARSAMSCASLLAGLAMNVSDCGAEHSLGQALGARYGLPHGLTVGLVLAETMEHDRPGAAALFERIADALGEPEDGSGDGSRAVRGVRRMLAAVDFPVLASAGVADEHLDELAAEALADPFIALAPVPWARDDVVTAFRAALALSGR
jgi:choline dehydrogenase